MCLSSVRLRSGVGRADFDCKAARARCTAAKNRWIARKREGPDFQSDREARRFNDSVRLKVVPFPV